MTTVRQIIKNNSKQLYSLLNGYMTPMPTQVCTCGKPIILLIKEKVLLVVGAKAGGIL